MKKILLTVCILLIWVSPGYAEDCIRLDCECTIVGRNVELKFDMPGALHFCSDYDIDGGKDLCDYGFHFTYRIYGRGRIYVHGNFCNDILHLSGEICFSEFECICRRRGGQ